MSAASLLSTYDGANPAVLVVDGVAGGAGVQNIAQVLAEAPAGAAGGLPLTDVGAFSCDTIASTNAGTFTITQATAGQGIAVSGTLGASLTAIGGGATLAATAGGVSVEAGAGVLKLDWDGAAGQLNLVPVGAQFSAVTIAAGKPTWVAAQQLQIKVGGVDYWIPMSSAAFA